MPESLAWLLPGYRDWELACFFLAFLLAGVVKGFLGMGLPTVLMASLTLFITPLEAITASIIPMAAVNLFQFLRSADRMATATRYAPLAVAAAATILAVSVNIQRYPEALLLGTIGVAMVLFSLNLMFGFPVRLGPHRGWQVLSGVAAGAIGGLSTVWAPPVVMYLLGRGVGKDEFIAATGYLFLVGSVSLALVLGTISVVTPPVAAQSAAPLAVALAGFRVGEHFRGHVDTGLFRKCVLAAFLVLGLRLVLQAVAG